MNDHVLNLMKKKFLTTSLRKFQPNSKTALGLNNPSKQSILEHSIINESNEDNNMN